MDDIYLKIRDFLKKRKYDSFTIHQICEMLEKDYGKQDVEVIKRKYFKSNEVYFNYSSLIYKEDYINDKLLSIKDMILPGLCIFIYIIANINEPQKIYLIFNFTVIFISFLYINYIDYLKDYKSLISKNIPIYTAVYVCTYYFITNPILQKFHYFSLDSHINIVSDLYVIIISFAFFIFIKIPRTIPFFVVMLIFSILFKEYFVFVFIVILLLVKLVDIKFIHNFTVAYKILLKNYFLKLTLDIKQYENLNIKSKKINQLLFSLLIITIPINIFVTLNYINIKTIQREYYNYMKEYNGLYCSNIPYDMKIIKSSSKYGYVVIDADDIKPNRLLYYIASKDPFNLGNINNEYQFPLDDSNISFQIFYKRKFVVGINYRQLVEYYYDNKEDVDTEYFAFIRKNKHLLNELDKHFIIYDYFLATNEHENLFFYKCE